MAAGEPTILATSGGYKSGHRTTMEFDLLVHHAVELSGVSGRAPRMAHISTASLVHQLVADGILGETHCTDDRVGLVYRGTELVDVVAEVRGKAAYRVIAAAGDSADTVAVEERLEPRFLG